MDWNLLKVFLAIAQNGSLAAAAKSLGVNHSTVFRRLNAFEESIGGRLFERLHHRYELTTMGCEVLELAQQVENSFDTLGRHIAGKDFQPKGIVKITAPNDIAYRYLPHYIAGFNLEYPDIHIELLVSNQEFNMNNRQADIAVRATSSPPEHLIGRKAASIRWSVYGTPIYAEQFGFPSHTKEFVHHKLIGATGSMRNLPVFIWLEKHFSQQIVTRCDDLAAMAYLVKSGQGLGVLPNDQLGLHNKKLFTLAEHGVSHIWLLTHPDLRNVERIKLVMQYLSTAFAKETSG